MKRIVIAVLLSLVGPGLGQIYNRDYKKGVIFLILSTVLFFVPTVWLIQKIAPLLPDPSQGAIDQEKVKAVALQVVQSDRHLLNWISFAFLGVWALSITQAYFKAREIQEKSEPTEEDSKPDDPTPS